MAMVALVGTAAVAARVATSVAVDAAAGATLWALWTHHFFGSHF